MKASRILLLVALFALLFGCSGGGGDPAPGDGDIDPIDPIVPIAQERVARIDFHDASNELVGYNLEVYDEDGNWLREESYYVGGALKSTMVFTLDGNRVLEYSSTEVDDPTDIRRTVFTYDEDGVLTGSTDYESPGNTLDSTLFYIYEDGVLDRIEQYDQDDNLEYTFSYSYTSGKRTGLIVTDDLGDELASEVFTYDGNGRLSEVRVSYGGSLYRINTITWEDEPVTVDFMTYFRG